MEKDVESLEKDESIDKQLNDVINEVHQQSPQEYEYDRDKVREIAESFSRKYVTLVRTRRGRESA